MFGDPITNPMGWEIKKIREVGIVKIGPFGSLLHKDDYITGGIPIVNPVHMKDGYIKPDLDFTVTQEKIDDLSSYVLRTNDFIFARRGDIGRCAIVREQDNGFICGTGSLFVRFKDKVEPIYTFYVSQSPSFINVLKEQAKGATMLNINCRIVENLHIPLPPLSLQQSFAAKVSAIEAKKQAISQSIQHTEALLAQRMDHYFS
jgi:type I restriction enzyme S subunit